MNYIADAILQCASSSNDTAKDILMHYGMKFRSGRYPYGSGDNPYQHEKHPKLTKSEVTESDFYDRVENLRKVKDFTWTDTDGLWGEKGKVYTGDTAIAHYMGLSTKQFRPAVDIARNAIRNQERAYAVKRREEGASLMTITKELGYDNDSSVRSLLNEETARRKSVAENQADFLKDLVDKHGFVEVGKGQEKYFDRTSRTKWDESLEILKMEGYEVYPRRFNQVTNPGQKTTFQILCPPGTEQKDVYQKVNNEKDIYFPSNEFVSRDGGQTFDPKFVYPKSMDSKRLAIRYSEDGGIDKDGLIEIRPGVADLDLGGSHYAQVRILVDGTHYIKGMAVYSDDIPEGKDIVFNTNKKKDKSLYEVLKPIKDDPKDPFGSLIKEGINDPDKPDEHDGGQSYYYDKDGNKQLSLINKRSDEGDWENWSKRLPAQFLAKQPVSLIRRQLDITENNKKLEYEDILEINNPTIKKVMLDKFADSCDKDSETLKAAALPRQAYKVILPLTTIKDDEVYAPGYTTGEKVCLVRFPHGGTFEIPYLTVNNHNKEGQSMITGNAADAVGISKKVADQLSGADFDGDTVLTIPTGGAVNIAHQPPLKGLEGFDTKEAYGGKPDANGKYPYKLMTNTQNEMGQVSNLITDMTLQGATEEDLVKAVKHSMVVIDAEKHHLDYQLSAKENDYAALKKKYQTHLTPEGKESTAASTLISRANAKVDTPQTKGSAIINPETGDKEYKLSGEMYIPTKTDKNKGTISFITKNVDKETGETSFFETIRDVKTNAVLYQGPPTRSFKETARTTKKTQMSQVRDAMDLVSPARTAEELAYANYANSMKSLARQARLEALRTPLLRYDREAAAKYADEVASLNAKLNESEKNAPLEKRAQFIANMREKEAKEKDPSLYNDNGALKKFRQKALSSARAEVGAARKSIDITPKEWEAIQNGAISDNKMKSIIKFVDDEKLKQLATPHGKAVLSEAKIAQIRNLAANGYTNEQIAKQFGISVSTVSKHLR